MRELTEEELKLAPEWATSYAVDEDDDVLFFNKGKDKIQSIDGANSFSIGDYRYLMRLAFKSRKIKKPFDITVYEFSDLEVGLADFNGDGIQINMVDGSRPPILNKRDAIAIAKALGVTAEDFK